MKDLGQDPTALSSVASTVPFTLLSHEAVLQQSRELFSHDVLDNCLHHTRPGSVQLRGMAPRYARFIQDFWHSPEVLKIISENATRTMPGCVSTKRSRSNSPRGRLLSRGRSTPQISLLRGPRILKASTGTTGSTPSKRVVGALKGRPTDHRYQRKCLTRAKKGSATTRKTGSTAHIAS